MIIGVYKHQALEKQFQIFQPCAHSKFSEQVRDSHPRLRMLTEHASKPKLRKQRRAFRTIRISVRCCCDRVAPARSPHGQVYLTKQWWSQLPALDSWAVIHTCQRQLEPARLYHMNPSTAAHCAKHGLSDFKTINTLILELPRELAPKSSSS